MANVIVIGGGPAGMMAAITAAEYGNNVTIIEKNSDFGKKLLITGKGRCNITSSLYMSEFIKNTPGNGQFLYSAFQNYTNTDIIDFLKNQGLEVKEERGNRIFPVTDKSIDVLNCFKSKKNELKIKKFGQTNPLFLRNSLNLYFRPRISTDLNGFEGRLRRLHTIEAGSAAGSEQYGSIPSTASFLATS